VRFVSQELLLKPFIWRILKVNIHGLANIESLEAPFVVVANHSSHLDAPLVVGSLPRRLSKFLATGAAADYFYASKIKSLSTALVANTYPIERRGLRTRKGLSKLLLSDGVPLLIFPEGTRSRTGAMGPFTPGVAALCISHNAPAVPIALVGAFAAWPYGQGHLPRGTPRGTRRHRPPAHPRARRDRPAVQRADAPDRATAARFHGQGLWTTDPGRLRSGSLLAAGVGAVRSEPCHTTTRNR